MLSWFSFWLGLDAIPGRVTLLVTCMLTLVTMFTGADIPPVAYVKVDNKSHKRMNMSIMYFIFIQIKALDLWMAGCMVFVFAALAEFVVVKVLDVQYQQAKQTSKTILPLRLTNMEKGQCQTVAMFDGTNVRSRKATSQNTPTPVGQVMA
jgi:exosortase/archaeosortase